MTNTHNPKSRPTDDDKSRVEIAPSVRIIGTPELIETEAGVTLKVEILNDGPVSLIGKIDINVRDGRASIDLPEYALEVGTGRATVEVPLSSDPNVTADSRFEVSLKDGVGNTLAVAHGGPPGIAAILTMVGVGGLVVAGAVYGAILIWPYISQFFGEPELGTGDVQFTLQWEGDADLDLHVIGPDETEIYFDNQSSPSGGTLDVDACRNGCQPGESRIENVYWPEGAAPEGSYTAWVHNFSGNSVEYQLVGKVDGSLSASDTAVLGTGATGARMTVQH